MIARITLAHILLFYMRVLPLKVTENLYFSSKYHFNKAKVTNMSLYKSKILKTFWNNFEKTIEENRNMGQKMAETESEREDVKTETASETSSV